MFFSISHFPSAIFHLSLKKHVSSMTDEKWRMENGNTAKYLPGCLYNLTFCISAFQSESSLQCTSSVARKMPESNRP
jgi:hypothetical protein